MSSVCHGRVSVYVVVAIDEDGSFSAIARCTRATAAPFPASPMAHEAGREKDSGSYLQLRMSRRHVALAVWANRGRNSR